MDIIYIEVDYHKKENKRVKAVNVSRLHRMCKRFKLKKKKATSTTHHLMNCKLKFACAV